MVTRDDALLQLYHDRLIAIDAVFEHASDRAEIEKRLSQGFRRGSMARDIAVRSYQTIAS